MPAAAWPLLALAGVSLVPGYQLPPAELRTETVYVHHAGAPLVVTRTYRRWVVLRPGGTVFWQQYEPLTVYPGGLIVLPQWNGAQMYRVVRQTVREEHEP